MKHWEVWGGFYNLWYRVSGVLINDHVQMCNMHAQVARVFEEEVEKCQGRHDICIGGRRQRKNG